MKFSHIADVHIGSWRDPKMKILAEESFIKAIDISIQEKVDFLLIAGDLFNTAIPGIDQIKLAIKKLQELKEKNIPVYYIAGSHDYSPSGKTMLDIIEEAKLGINVTKGKINEQGKLQLQFTEDPKTGAKITGLIGRRGMLERKYYEALDTTNLEQENGFKIFMFHTSIDELKPKELQEMESNPISFLPKGFDYYAGGHVHIVAEYNEQNLTKKTEAQNTDNQNSKPRYQNVIYPGPTFPANFSELEKLNTGGFYIYDEGKLERKTLKIKETIIEKVLIENENPEQATTKIKNSLKNQDVQNKIILLRIEGQLSTGTTDQIEMKEIIQELYQKGAYFVMKNTNKLKTQEFKEIKIEEHHQEQIENKLIKEHLNQTENDFQDEEKLTKTLIQVLSQEKNEAEKQSDYEKRIQKDIDQTLESQ
ncbi:exonuclease SbcCD subunit D [Candidatus Woesearchaeota archaeon]|nr:exonuclease SbcCD subunit D [Candidatus Woesearchaeota archaeon]